MRSSHKKEKQINAKKLFLSFSFLDQQRKMEKRCKNTKRKNKQNAQINKADCPTDKLTDDLLVRIVSPNVSPDVDEFFPSLAADELEEAYPN